MDEQELNKQTQEQEQNSADFLSGFNSVRSPDEESPEPKRVEKEAAAEVAPEQPVKEEAKDEPMFFGMTESQIKSLLERSARVDDIENQLRKAHGKIGELNANFQNLSTQQKPTQSAPATQVVSIHAPRFREAMLISRNYRKQQNKKPALREPLYS